MEKSTQIASSLARVTNVSAGIALAGICALALVGSMPPLPRHSARVGGAPFQNLSSGAGQTIGPRGGRLSTLSFAIVGDTRPPTQDDTSAYPTAIINKIWQDVQAATPRPAFAVTPGNYMFAKPSGDQAVAQLGLYESARANYSNVVFPAMGSHECTGAITSNCGPGNKDGVTNNYRAFLSKMLVPMGLRRPYYVINVSGANKPWTAKFVFVASNAWNDAQAKWLDTVLSRPTTYTFIVRNAPVGQNNFPCLSGSGMSNADTIIGNHPYTLLIVGHTHTYQYTASRKQVIVGNGGAPLTGSINYGYVIARQQANGSMLFTAYDFNTNAVISSFTVRPS